MEYVGHVVSAEGVTFSTQKRNKVLDFPLPRKQKEIQSFLGLINYFRDNVADMTTLERPLRSLIDHTKRNRVLLWNTIAETCFHNAREQIARCPALFFADEHATIIVMTDASDYGVGSYIFQVIDEKERPIIFFSKALHGAELNWSTIEKEAFAIFLTLTKFSYLFRDNKFLLRTDHKNLTYIDAGSSQKVRRWGIALQEFDFDIEHVPGKDNFVADSFSRLCANKLTPAPTPVETLAVIEHEIFPHRLSDEIQERIALTHNAEVGHFGVDKTINHLVAKGLKWKNMRRHVRQIVQLCPVCQKLRERHLALKAHPFTTAAYLPMDVLNIDTIGPVDNKYILVIIDCFTRWVELFPIPDTSAIFRC